MGENQIFPKFLLGNLKQFLGKQPPKKWEHHFPVTKDSFKEIKKIGSGGYATIYRALHKVDHTEYAIK